MIELIEFNNKKYPKFQSTGFASRFVFPFANEVCKGIGFDIGCMNKEWAYPGSIPIDLSFNDGYHALNLPHTANYIFSSHCLEHINDWVKVLKYWETMLETKGVLFLYLPDYSQEYWRPWNNTKHVNILTPQIVQDCLINFGFKNIFVSGIDLNNSFTVMAEKQ